MFVDGLGSSLGGGGLVVCVDDGFVTHDAKSFDCSVALVNRLFPNQTAFLQSFPTKQTDLRVWQLHQTMIGGQPGSYFFMD